MMTPEMFQSLCETCKGVATELGEMPGAEGEVLGANEEMPGNESVESFDEADKRGAMRIAEAFKPKKKGE